MWVTPRQWTLRGSILGALVVTLLLAAVPTAPARFNGSRHSFDKRSTCREPEMRTDPIGVIFTGRGARMQALGSFRHRDGYVIGDIEKHSGWGEESSSPTKYANSDICDLTDFEVSTVGTSRYHVRLWEQEESFAGGRYRTAGTPHYDQHLDVCGGHHVPPGPFRLAFGSTGSGYDTARERLRYWYAHNSRGHHHNLSHVYWRDSQPVSQCNGRFDVASNGYVLIITAPR